MSTPNVQLRDVFALTDLDESYQNATLKVTGTLRNLSSVETQRTLRVTLVDQQGKRSVLGTTANVTLEPGQEGVATLAAQIEKPRLWTAETPNLYTVILEQVTTEGQVTEVKACRLGFREVEIRDQQILSQLVFPSCSRA